MPTILENLKGLESKCDKCGKIIGKNNFKKHYNSCGKTAKNIKKTNLTGKNWNKNKTYEEIFGKEKSDEIKQKISMSRQDISFKHTEETKKKISIKMLNNKNWLFSGLGKKGFFEGNYFGSSWEMAFIIYCKDHSIKLERNWKSYKYINSEGKEKNYIPDFFLPEENKFIEIKGYKTEDSILKETYFSSNIETFDKDKIKPILDYIISKYGKNFYDELKDKEKKFLDKNKNFCICGKEILKKSKKCHSCKMKEKRKVVRPDKDILIEEIKLYGYSKIGKKYGVSGNAVKKWIQ